MYSQIFICFSAKDRYTVVESLVHNLRNYGFNVWYDRIKLLMGDNRVEKNLIEGAKNSSHSILVISKNTTSSRCAMEEMSMVKEQYMLGKQIIFPILYEIPPQDVPSELDWVKSLIFKEIDHSSGTRDVCNHIACNITREILSVRNFTKIEEVISSSTIPYAVTRLVHDYTRISHENINARASMLYSLFILLREIFLKNNNEPQLVLSDVIINRLFSESRLCIKVDYREIWLMENALCIALNYYSDLLAESNI